MRTYLVIGQFNESEDEHLQLALKVNVEWFDWNFLTEACKKKYK